MKTRRHAITLIETIVVLAIVGVLMGLVFVGIQSSRLSAARAKCANQLKQMGLALVQYHDSYQAFPSGWSVNEELGAPLFLSWQSRCLPYLEQPALWDEARSNRSYNDVAPTVVPIFICPMISRSSSNTFFGWAYTTYLGVEGTSYLQRDGILYYNARVRLTDVIDGTSNTTLVGERPPGSTGRISFWYGFGGLGGLGAADVVLGEWEVWAGEQGFIGECPGMDWSNHFKPGRLGDPCDDLHFWSLHPGGANFLFADGAVRFLSYSAGNVHRTADSRTSITHSLATRAGGEVIPPY